MLTNHSGIIIICAERGEVRVVGIYQPVSSSSVLNHAPVPLFKWDEERLSLLVLLTGY